MQYLKLAKVSDFEQKNIKSFSIIGKKIGIIKRKDGTFYATEIGCKHQNADLSQGKIEGHIATCHRHGWQYNLETGECLNHNSNPLKKYPLKIEGEDILVGMTPVTQ